jgi:hypothetical protein
MRPCDGGVILEISVGNRYLDMGKKTIPGHENCWDQEAKLKNA